MGDDDDGVLKFEQVIFQPAHRLDVEVVGRLVQKQHVGVAEQRLRQQYLDLELCVQLAHRLTETVGRDIKFVQKRLRVRLRFPAAEFGKFRLQLAGADAVFIGKICLGVQRLALVHQIDQVLMPQHHRAQHRLIVVGVLVLHQHGHALVFAQRHLALVRLDLAGKDLQKGRFARAVGADDAVAIPLCKF